MKNAETEEDVKIVRQMKSILNKLSEGNFDKLSEQILTIGISKERHLEELTKEVFEKVTTQHNFIEIYTKLCVKIADKLVFKETEEERLEKEQKEEAEKAA